MAHLDREEEIQCCPIVCCCCTPQVPDYEVLHIDHAGGLECKISGWNSDGEACCLHARLLSGLCDMMPLELELTLEAHIDS